jgi:hypothetical protein
MKGFDAFAGVIKSGGKTRRAAKMVILNVDHPDIREFIHSKAGEEKKAWSLIDAGYDGGFNVPGGAYDSIFFQNANHSVRVTDAFMEASEAKGRWNTKAVLDGRVVGTYEARELLDEMAEAAHVCGDPGMQFDSTINRWNPVKASGRINSSNPCSEYMFLDDTACNLSSLNLMTFLNEDGEFQVEDFRRAVAIMILAQEIIVDPADYPTEEIQKNSRLFRPLGLGYANLGALLMSFGEPYDSDQGRNLSASITSLMCGQAYLTSAEVAKAMGPFPRYTMNRKPFLEVIGMHKDAASRVPIDGVPADLHAAARESWAEALALGTKHGYKNGQVTVLARNDRLHDGLRYDGRGARHRARQVQEAGGRRIPEDREPHGRDGPPPAGLRRAGRPRDRRLHRRVRDDRRSTWPRGRAPGRLRLRLPLAKRRALHPLDGPHPHDGCGAALPVGRHQQDGEPARGRDRGRRVARLRRGLAAGAQGSGGLPRWQQAHAAAQRGS